MLVAVRAEVENVDRWREGFKTHGDVFASQKISIAYLGATDDNKVIAVCETSDLDEFMKVFNYAGTDKDDDAQLKLGLSYQSMGSIENAKNEFQRLIDYFPGSEYYPKAKDALRKLSID